MQNVGFLILRLKSNHLCICLKTMRSCSLPTLHNKDTGRKLEESELSSFFGIGIRLECFQDSGNLPSLNDLLNKIFKGTETSLATGLSILLPIPSGPLALIGYKISIKD